MLDSFMTGGKHHDFNGGQLAGRAASPSPAIAAEHRGMLQKTLQYLCEEHHCSAWCIPGSLHLQDPHMPHALKQGCKTVFGQQPSFFLGDSSA